MTYPVEFFLSEMVDAPVSFCCQNSCGLLVPLVANGSYNGPSGDGKTRIYFNLSNSPFCGISVARVLRGDLDSLAERDDLAILNPKSGSMRLRIGWPGYKKFVRKINTPNDRFRIEDLVRKVCAQVKAFIDNAEIGDVDAPGWMVGEGGITVEQLMLVSVKRTSAGTWIPQIRVINNQDAV